jgi:hypothetical protein
VEIDRGVCFCSLVWAVGRTQPSFSAELHNGGNVGSPYAASGYNKQLVFCHSGVRLPVARIGHGRQSQSALTPAGGMDRSWRWLEDPVRK